MLADTSTSRSTPAATPLQWLAPVALLLAAAGVVILMAPAPSADLAAVAGDGSVQPAAQAQPALDAAAVDWERIAAEPDPSPLAVAAYGR
jgi:hypothetical protein